MLKNRTHVLNLRFTNQYLSNSIDSGIKNRLKSTLFLLRIVEIIKARR